MSIALHQPTGFVDPGVAGLDQGLHASEPRRIPSAGRRACGRQILDGIVADQRSDETVAAMLIGHESHKRSEEHTSELQSLMRISYAVFCLKKKKHKRVNKQTNYKTDYQLTSTHEIQ